MYQNADDALFIRLGINIAEGHWLGKYDELTLVKGPIYSIMLYLNSLSGLPINITQFSLYYLSSLYLSYTISKIMRSKLLGLLSFLLLLLTPSLYLDDLRRIIRTIFYISIVYILVACWIDLFILSSARIKRYGLAIGTGICLAAVWMAREEAFIVVPSLLVIFASGMLLISEDEMRRERITAAFTHMAIALGSALAVFGIIASLNFVNYGRFVVVEMKDSDFQSALIALQKVGGAYDRPYVPLPREARDALYAESRGFSSLRKYLDPSEGPTGWVNLDCKMLPSTCNDISGGRFFWALRGAAAEAGMHDSAQHAAKFYGELASEVNAACATHRVPCLAWLPPLIPHITASQWATFSSNLLRGFQLLALIPPPLINLSQMSDLNAPDGATAVAFLNRPFQSTDSSNETTPHVLLRSAWLFIVVASIPLLQLIIAIGTISLLISIFVRRLRLLNNRAFWVLVALLSLSATQIFVLVLAHISSFLTLYHERTVVAEPFLLLAAVVAIHLAYESLAT
jgi:hypothetical protein